MFTRRVVLKGIAALSSIGLLAACRPGLARPQAATGPDVALPEPEREGGMSLHTAIEIRRSIRNYTDEPLTLWQAGQLLWAGQGVTDPRRLRASPSAGATYPLELYLVAGNVEGLDAGIYNYDPGAHSLRPVATGDVRRALAEACVGQAWVAQGPLSVVFAADFPRTTGRYGERGVMYVHMEVGHVSQNIYLQAVSLGLGTVAVGAFDNERVADLVGLPQGQTPLYVMPIGRTANRP